MKKMDELNFLEAEEGKWRWGPWQEIWGFTEGCRGRWWPGQLLQPAQGAAGSWGPARGALHQEGSDAEDVSEIRRLHERLKEKLPTWRMNQRAAEWSTVLWEEWVVRSGGWTNRKGTVAFKRLPSPYLRGRRRKLLQGSSWNGEKIRRIYEILSPFPSVTWSPTKPSHPQWETAALVCCVVSSLALYSWLRVQVINYTSWKLWFQVLCSENLKLLNIKLLQLSCFHAQFLLSLCPSLNNNKCQ